jgi:MFS family permease
MRPLALAGLATFLVSFDSAVITLALPAISTDFHSSPAGISRLASVLAVGTLAGVPLAVQADRIGRRRLLTLAVAAFSLANLGSALAPSLSWLLAWRVLAVAFETAAAGVAVALVIEEVRPGQRGLAVASITIASGAGTGLTTLLYPFLAPHWRVLYVLGATGLIGAVVLSRHLRESSAWAAARTGEGASRPSQPLTLLWEPRWRRRLIVAAAAAALGALLYEPANLLVALFGSRELGLSPTLISAVVIASGLASVPAFLVGGRLSDRFGRRSVGVGLSLVTAVLAALTFGGSRPAYWVGNLGWSFLASASVPVFGAWFGELFPTRARATSESVSSVAAALGGAAGFQVVGLLQPRLGLGLSLALPAVAALVAACLLLLLPETRGEPLQA